MDQNIIEALKWIFGFGAGVFLMIGAYWGKTMSNDIKVLQGEQNKINVFMAKIEESLSGRDKVQDIRWNALDEKIQSMHRDLQAIVHSRMRTVSRVAKRK